MPVPERLEFFVDPGRCIGCNACVQACTECDTHKGVAMIQLDYIDRARSPQTVPLAEQGSPTSPQGRGTAES